MNLKENTTFFLDKVIFIPLLVGICIYLDSSTDWHPVFVQSGVSILGIFTIALGYLLASSISAVWVLQPLNHRVHLWMMGLPLLLFWILYHQVLSTWWTADDPALLEYIHEVGPLTMLFSETRGLFYAPLQPLSLALDYSFFGLQPSGFYWHHLLSFSLVVLLIYAILSQFFSPLLASMMVSLFISMVPSAHVAHYLMVRHYLEGFGLALLATGCYLRAINAPRFYNLWAIVGSILYLGASLAKEIYVPLPMILLTLPRGTFQQRLYHLWPWLIATVIYTGLRIYSVGWDDLLASYPERSTHWQDVLDLPMYYIECMGWRTSWQWLVLGTVVIVLLIRMRHRPYFLGISSVVWLIAVLGPLWPILWRLVYLENYSLLLKYYLFLVAFLTTLACGLAWSQLAQWLKTSRWRTLLINIWFFSVFFANLMPTQRDQFYLYQDKNIKYVESQFLLNNHLKEAVLIDNDYYAAQHVVNLRKKVLGQIAGPVWCAVDDCHCSLLYPGYTSWKYLNDQWKTGILSPDKHCGREVNLSLQITLVSPTQLHWQLGPYTGKQGTYYVWAVAIEEKFNLSYISPQPIPSQGLYTFEQALTQPIKVLVKYQSSEGWETYTPVLVVDPKQANAQGIVEVNWHRSTQAEE